MTPKLVQVQVPKELYDRFREALPMRGAPSWLVRTAMEYFIAEFADDPASALHRGLIRMRQDLTELVESATLGPGGSEIDALKGEEY